MNFDIEVFYVVLGAILSHLPLILKTTCRFLKHHWVRFKVHVALSRSLSQRAASGEDVPRSMKAAKERVLQDARYICGYRALSKSLKEKYLTIAKAIGLFTASYGATICRGEGCMRVFTHHDQYISEKDLQAWDLLQMVLEEEDAWIVRQIYPERYGIAGETRWLLEISTGVDRKEVLEKPSKDDILQAIEELEKLEQRKKEQLAAAKA